MIEKLKNIVANTPNLDKDGNVVGLVRSIRHPNNVELMNKINEIIEVLNNK